MSSASFYGSEQCRESRSNSQGMVNRAGWPLLDNCLDVLHLWECGLADRPTLLEPHRVPTNELTEVCLWSAEPHCLEECMGAAEEAARSLCMARAHVDELTAE